jgi:hypothetical protein
MIFFLNISVEVRILPGQFVRWNWQGKTCPTWGFAFGLKIEIIFFS